MEEIKNRDIIPNRKALAEYTGICVPTLDKLIRRRNNPLPSVRVSPRKVVFVAEDVLTWFREEAARQSNGIV